MILKTLLSYTIILGLILITGWCRISQGTNFVTFVRIVLSSTPVTYVLFRHSTLKVGNYTVVPIVPIIK